MQEAAACGGGEGRSPRKDRLCEGQFAEQKLVGGEDGGSQRLLQCVRGRRVEHEAGRMHPAAMACEQVCEQAASRGLGCVIGEKKGDHDEFPCVRSETRKLSGRAAWKSGMAILPCQFFCKWRDIGLRGAYASAIQAGQ